MYGYETDGARSAKDFLGTAPETPLFHRYRFSGHHSLSDKKTFFLPKSHAPMLPAVLLRCNSYRNLICLLGVVFFILNRIFLSISLKKCVCLFKRYLALDITGSSTHQIFGYFQSNAIYLRALHSLIFSFENSSCIISLACCSSSDS